MKPKQPATARACGNQNAACLPVPSLLQPNGDRAPHLSLRAWKLGIALIVMLAVVAPLRAQVLPANSTLFGRTVGDLTVDYLKFFIGLSTNQPTTPPPIDRAGLVALPLWLSPPCIPVPNSQTSNIPENLYVLVPILFVGWDNIDVDPPWTVEEMRAAAASCIDSAFLDLKASIDGVSINVLKHREPTPAFGFTFHSADNFFTCVYGRPFVGIYDPALADGYWVLAEPLSAGLHTFHLAVTGTCFSTAYDVTMYANIVEVPVERWVEDFIEIVEPIFLQASHKRAPMQNLEKAKAFFESGKMHAGISHLRQFQREVRTALTLSDSGLANDFISYAQRIINRAQRE